MSEKRRGDAWTEAARNDEVACGLPREGIAISAAPERIEDMSEKRRGDGPIRNLALERITAMSGDLIVMHAVPERIEGT